MSFKSEAQIVFHNGVEGGAPPRDAAVMEPGNGVLLTRCAMYNDSSEPNAMPLEIECCSLTRAKACSVSL